MRTNEELIKIIIDKTKFKVEELQDLENYQLSFICDNPQYWADSGMDVQEIADDAKDRYIGKYNNMVEFAKELISETYDLSELLNLIRFNIDWNGVVDDLEYAYFITEDGHVFEQ